MTSSEMIFEDKKHWQHYPIGQAGTSKHLETRCQQSETRSSQYPWRMMMIVAAYVFIILMAKAMLPTKIVYNPTAGTLTSTDFN